MINYTQKIVFYLFLLQISVFLQTTKKNTTAQSSKTAVAQNTVNKSNKTEGDKIPAGYLNTKDSLALVAVYKKLGGSKWFYKWSLNQPISRWKGVSVEHGFVVALELAKNNLTGEIPVEIGDLTHLQILDLSKNTIGGSIPEELFKLKDLKYLDLSKEILRNSSGRLVRAKSENTEFSKNTKTDSLVNQEENLTAQELLEDSINTKKTKLSLEILKLGLSDNVSPKIGDLQKLEYLDLSGNSLTGALPNIQTLKKLKHCNLSVNYFEGNLPVKIKDMLALKHLDLSYNKLNGVIPKEILSLKRLRYLSLAHNSLSGEIPGLKGIEIDYIFLEGNNFDNDLPSARQVSQKEIDIQRTKDEDLAKQKMKEDNKNSAQLSEDNKAVEIEELDPTEVDQELEKMQEELSILPSEN